MNLADPELEYIDPTPNVHSLFIHFDTVFFSTKLAGKAVVRWSKRMFSCAGTCSYEGRGGICDIALSEPLLKLRPRKDLVETLLHEMIHAFLFVVGKDQSRNGHGPNFLAHMNRINQAAGLNISIYHDFHDEVRLYQNHVWRCNGPCQRMRPYFGIVRRSMNKAPGPSDYWWNRHKRACGGTFIKCQEPEIPAKQVTAKKINKPKADITKYINNNNVTIKSKNMTEPKKDSIVTIKSLNKEVPKPVIKPVIAKPVFPGGGQTGGTNWSSSVGVLETVRNVWANKTLPSTISAGQTHKVTSKTPKRTSDASQTDSLTPPKKIKKIDDYFKTTASSILKDIYGKDFTITQSNDTNKLKAIVVKDNVVREKIVDCPICYLKISELTINAHLDECLNKDLIRDMSVDTVIMKPNTGESNNINKRRGTIADLPFQPDFKTKINQQQPKSEHKNNMQSINSIKSGIKVQKDHTFVKSEVKSPGDYIDLTFSIPTNSKIKKEPIQDSIDLTAFQHEPSTSKETSTCPCCGKIINKPIQEHLDECLTFFDNNTIPEEGCSKPRTNIKHESMKDEPTTVKHEPIPSLEDNQTCPCCGDKLKKPVQEHLDECLVFFDNNTTIPEEGSSFGDRTVVIDDSDDEFDETQTYNATGTKSPCPCCMKMVEEAEMSDHLDTCLGL